MPTSLTERQRRFVDAYATTPDPAEAAVLAGYSEKSAARTAVLLLENPKITEAIALHGTEGGRVAVSRDTVKLGLFREANDFSKGATQTCRIRAWELLGKITGCFQDAGADAPVSVSFDIRLEREAE